MIKKVENVILRAVDDPAIYHSLSSSPPEIAILASILPAARSEILSRRYNQLVTELKVEADLIDQTKVDKSFFKNEEFYDLFVKALRSTFETTNNHKIQLYARILLRPAILDNAEFKYYAKDFVSIISELSPPDLQLAREIYKQQMNIRADEINRGVLNELHLVDKSGFYRLREVVRFDKAEFDLALTKLVRAGLIRQVVGSSINTQVTLLQSLIRLER